MFFIKQVDNFLSKEECDLILSKYKETELQTGFIGNHTEADSTESLKKLKLTRDSQITFFPIDDIAERILNIIQKEIPMKGFEFSKLNNFQFTKYGLGGHYDWHVDSTPTMFSERFCSTVIQLNDDYEGGNLLYKIDNKTYEFNTGVGNLYIFNSSLYHKVTPITLGERYSLVNWIKINEIKNYKKSLV